MWMEHVLGTTLTWATLYLLAGVVFALPFFLLGLKRIDPLAAEGSWGFRLLILPGVIWFWPKLLWRWCFGSGRPDEEHNAHRLHAKRRSLAQHQDELAASDSSSSGEPKA